MASGIGSDEVANTCRENYVNPSADIVQKYKTLCVPYCAKNSYSVDEISRCIQRPHIFEHYCRHHVNSFDYLPVMHNVQCPTLLMVGEKKAQAIRLKQHKQWLNLLIKST